MYKDGIDNRIKKGWGSSCSAWGKRNGFAILNSNCPLWARTKELIAYRTGKRRRIL